MCPPRLQQKFHQLILKPKKFLGKTQSGCQNPAAHKNIYIGPEVLRRHNIPYHVVVQRPEDLILTMSDYHHEDFNEDNNVYSAVNFADRHWLSFRKAYFRWMVDNMMCHCLECQRKDISGPEQSASRKGPASTFSAEPR